MIERPVEEVGANGPEHPRSAPGSRGENRQDVQKPLAVARRREGEELLQLVDHQE